MTTEVQKVNKNTKKEKLKVKHGEEGNESILVENEQIVQNKKKSKKNKKIKENNSESQDVAEEHLIEKLENTEKEKGEKRQMERDESQSKRKKLKKSKKNKDTNALNTMENKEQDNIVNEIEDEDEDEDREEKPKKEPSKRQLKREKAALRKAETKEVGKQGNAKKALNYVSMWKHAKSEWKFNKVVQAWLIHNLLDENYVPDDQYPTVLEYFESSVGSARKQLISRAMAVIKKVEEQVEKEEDEEVVETTEYKRARQLLQALPTET